MPRLARAPSGALDRLRRRVEGVDDRPDLLGRRVPAAQAQLKGGAQIEHRSLDRNETREPRALTAARAWRIVAPAPLAELLDDLVAVARLLGDQRDNPEPQLAAVEHAALPAA